MNDTQDTISVSKRDHWQQRVERWRQSGLSMRAFCRQENISFNGLRYWKNKEAERTVGSRPVKLSIPIVPSMNLRAVIEVVVCDRFRGRVPEGFQSGELERVIRGLESVK